MARIARVVAPGVPHHITQRGNRRQVTFFSEYDYELYLSLLSKWCAECGVEVWAYCLMSNHVHIIAVPETTTSLAEAMGSAHRRYTRHVNLREDWRGHLWQGRFASFPLDNRHLMAAARYVELNPVRAGMVEHPVDYRWSSASAHMSGKDDGVVRVRPLLEIEPNWAKFLSADGDEEEFETFRLHERTGRPMGDEQFVEEMEAALRRPLKKRRPGRKPMRSCVAAGFGK